MPARQDETPRPQPGQARADYVKEQAHGVDPGPLAAPRNLDVPLVMGEGTVGAVLSCTMGNWTGEPDGYSYRWMADGATLTEGEAAEYTVAAGDAGKSVSCVVTATNAEGSTAAPPSNAVAIT